MDSYQLDQPLDLRLKALNLSRTFNHVNSTETNVMMDLSYYQNNIKAGPVSLPASEGCNNIDVSHQRLMRLSASVQRVSGSSAEVVDSPAGAHNKQFTYGNSNSTHYNNNNNNNQYSSSDNYYNPYNHYNQYNHYNHCNNYNNHNHHPYNHSHQYSHHHNHPTQCAAINSTPSASIPNAHKQQKNDNNNQHHNQHTQNTDSSPELVGKIGRTTSLNLPVAPLASAAPAPIPTQVQAPLSASAQVSALVSVPVSVPAPAPVLVPTTIQAPSLEVTLQSASPTSQASPITRQHSLVSRYHCKPCGIVFSHQETLRAHQEGYCTKRDRTQLRSQSAVSPTALQKIANDVNHK